MTQYHDKTSILAGLQDSSQAIATASRQLSSSDFAKGTDTEWSPAGYLIHLILSVKPFVRVLRLPHDKLETLFGKATTSSMAFTDLIEAYDAQLQAGMRAENSPNFVPASYKLPDSVEDDNLQDHLIDTWKVANDHLGEVLKTWSEDDMDIYCLPHPALSNLTIREMCFFTIYHNQVHLKDIQQST